MYHRICVHNESVRLFCPAPNHFCLVDVEFRYRFVWEKTARMYSEITEVEGWDKQDVVEVPSAQRYTSQVR